MGHDNERRDLHRLIRFRIFLCPCCRQGIDTMYHRWFISLRKLPIAPPGDATLRASHESRISCFYTRSFRARVSSVGIFGHCSLQIGRKHSQISGVCPSCSNFIPLDITSIMQNRNLRDTRAPRTF